MTQGGETVVQLWDARLDERLATLLERPQDVDTLPAVLARDRIVTHLRNDTPVTHVFARLLRHALDLQDTNDQQAAIDDAALLHYAQNVATALKANPVSAGERSVTEAGDGYRLSLIEATTEAYQVAVVDHSGYIYKETITDPLARMAHYVSLRGALHQRTPAIAPAMEFRGLPFVMSAGFNADDSFDPVSAQTA